MKCVHCGAEIDDGIEIDGWNRCPICHTPMLAFADDVLDIAVEMVLRDVLAIEKRLRFILDRIRADKTSKGE